MNTLLIAPEGIEICFTARIVVYFLALLIAPEGIEILLEIYVLFHVITLLIAPEGIEITEHRKEKGILDALNRTRRN